MNEERKNFQQAELLVMAERNRILEGLGQLAGPALKMQRQKLQIASAVLRGLASLIDLTAPADLPSATP